MFNQEKAKKYSNLVDESQDEYRNHPEAHKDDKIVLAAPDLKIAVVDGKIDFVKGVSFCREINLYTYWQGRGYAEKTPPIKYLLVAQDWGNPFNMNSPLMERIIRINRGDEGVRYFDKTDFSVSDTDANLVELFKCLGYGENGKPSIADEQYSELFFTNFCLGYRTGRESSGLTKTLMKQDGRFFHELCAILEPEKILCLGRLTFECAYEALANKSAASLPYFDGKYSDFIESHGDIVVTCGNRQSKIYPLAHCGFYGSVVNRSLDKQMQDWKRIIA